MQNGEVVRIFEELADLLEILFSHRSRHQGDKGHNDLPY